MLSSLNQKSKINSSRFYGSLKKTYPIYDNPILETKKGTDVFGCRLSFKGASSFGMKAVKFSKAGAFEKFGELFGAENLRRMDEILEKLSKKGIIQVDGDEVLFHDESLLKRSVKALGYPFSGMILDISNSLIGALPKNKQEFFRKGLLKSRHEKVVAEEEMHSLRGFLELFKDFEDNKIPEELIIKAAHKALDPNKGQYNSMAERILVAILTGIISTNFHGVDAYNTSILSTENTKEAKKEKRSRINQEIVKTSITVFSTLTVLQALKKFSNKSVLSSSIVLVTSSILTEILARTLTKRPVLLLSPEKAKKLYGDKDKKPQNETIKTEHKEEKSKPKKINNFGAKAFLVFASLVVAGFGVNKVSSTKFMESLLKSWTELKDKIIKKEIKYTKADYERLTSIFEGTKFKELYNKVVVEKDGFVYLGKKGRRIMEPLVEIGLIMPFKMMKFILMSPYNLVSKFSDVVSHSINTKSFKRGVMETLGKGKKEELDVKDAQNALEWAERALSKKKNSIEDVKEQFNKNVIASLDDVSRPNFSSNELSSFLKYLLSIAASYFLIADHYNVVMRQTKGGNEDLAAQKAQERGMQQLAKIFFSGWIVHVINEMTKAVYNRSLLAVGLISMTTCSMYELLVRVSVGLPMRESSKEEILSLEKKNQSRKGLAGKYFRAMSFLTGKTSLSEKIKDKKEEQKELKVATA